MKTKYKNIHLEGSKENGWSVHVNDECNDEIVCREIGSIGWKYASKQYVFRPFDASGEIGVAEMSEIIHFTKHLKHRGSQSG